MEKFILIFFVILLVSGCNQQNPFPIIQKEELETETSTVTQNSISQNIFTGDIQTLLPTREEINTEYKIVRTIESNLTYYYFQHPRENLYLNGFKEGKTRILSKDDGYRITTGYIDIFKFDTSDDTKKFYDSFISLIKNEGGYKEISNSGVNAQCFAIDSGNSEGYHRDFYCVKNNIFFDTETNSGIVRPTDSKEWARTIAGKI